MSNITLEPKRLLGSIIPPADKSISHRAIIISSLAKEKTRVKNLSVCDDCLRTIDALRSLGISIVKDKDSTLMHGKGLDGLRNPKEKLYLGNSGTTMRLMLGILAAQKFNSVLTGDDSLSRRPMKRVILPLSLMGAKIEARKIDGNSFPPLIVQGRKLKAINYQSPVASAQVKSTILLAGLYAAGQTKVTEPAKSRDHTERMLKKFGADISVEGLSVCVQGKANLNSKDVTVPGDISSASFFLVGACISKGSQLTVQSVGLNSTRIAFLNILQKMGAQIKWSIQNNQMIGDDGSEEPTGEINITYSHLQATTVGPQQIPALIDELPILFVAATQAEGETLIQGAGELRVKETDRISAMVSNLSRMGANITSFGDDIIIRGPSRLMGSRVDSYNDHRIAMSMAIAGLIASGRTTIKDVDCVDVSFPNFFANLSRLLS